MILPQPRARMAGASRRMVSIAAVRSSARVSCQADSGASSSGRMSSTSPALLTRMSIGPPSRAAASVQRCSTCRRSVRSAAIAATGASAAREASSAAAAALERYAIATAAPLSMNASLMARPMPVAPPVTRARRPRRST